jgi:hypothetical protein
MFLILIMLYLLIKMQVKSPNIPNISFLIEDPIDFSVSSSGDPTEVSIFSTSGGNPTYFLLKKTRKSISANINTTTFSFGAPQQFSTVDY